jgi:hypothetical protein
MASCHILICWCTSVTLFHNYPGKYAMYSDPSVAIRLGIHVPICNHISILCYHRWLCYYRWPLVTFESGGLHRPPD